MLNMLVYLLGMLPLTYLMVNLRPTLNTTDPGNKTVIMVPIRFTEVRLEMMLIIYVKLAEISIEKEEKLLSLLKGDDHPFSILNYVINIP